MDEKELAFRFQMFEQQIMQIQQQLQAVEQGINELNTLNKGLDELVGSKGKEIFAPIGRGIFVSAKVTSEELTVDVGEKKFVKKSIPDTKKIISEQIVKLGEVKEELERNLDGINQELTGMIIEAQDNKGCSCGHEHCGEDGCEDEECDENCSRCDDGHCGCGKGHCDCED